LEEDLYLCFDATFAQQELDEKIVAIICGQMRQTRFRLVMHIEGGVDKWSAFLRRQSAASSDAEQPQERYHPPIAACNP